MENGITNNGGIININEDDYWTTVLDIDVDAYPYLAAHYRRFPKDTIAIPIPRGIGTRWFAMTHEQQEAWLRKERV